MPNEAMEIKAISAHPGPVAGGNVSRDYDVCKLIDVTTCIGCKACEVACIEWNGYEFRETTFDNTYQTMPDTAWNYWNLIRFNEDVDSNGDLVGWLMRKEQCIGCQYCVTGCPFNIPKFNPTTKKVFKCTLCSDRVGAGLEPACIKSCPTGCLHFGSKDDMKDLAEKRAAQLRSTTSYQNAGVYDPEGVGGTHVIYVLHNAKDPEKYGGLPANPRVPIMVRLWKHPLKWLGNIGLIAGIAGVLLHYVRFGPKVIDKKEQTKP